MLMIYSALWLLTPPQGSSSEGAAWVMLGTQQLCGGYRFVLPPLCFRFSAFLLQSEQVYLNRSHIAATAACKLGPWRGKCRATRGEGRAGR